MTSETHLYPFNHITVSLVYRLHTRIRDHKTWPIRVRDRALWRSRDLSATRWHWPGDWPRDLSRDRPRDLSRNWPRDLFRDWPRDISRDWPRDVSRDWPRDDHQTTAVVAIVDRGTSERGRHGEQPTGQCDLIVTGEMTNTSEEKTVSGKWKR